MVVPARAWDSKHLGVGLGGLTTFDVAVTSEEAIKGLHFIIGLQVSEHLNVTVCLLRIVCKIRYFVLAVLDFLILLLSWKNSYD